MSICCLPLSILMQNASLFILSPLVCHCLTLRTILGPGLPPPLFHRHGNPPSYPLFVRDYSYYLSEHLFWGYSGVFPYHYSEVHGLTSVIQQSSFPEPQQGRFLTSSVSIDFPYLFASSPPRILPKSPASLASANVGSPYLFACSSLSNLSKSLGPEFTRGPILSFDCFGEVLMYSPTNFVAAHFPESPPFALRWKDRFDFSSPSGLIFQSTALLSPLSPSYEFLLASSLWKNRVDFLHLISCLFVQALTLASANAGSSYLFACSSLSNLPKSSGPEFTRGPILSFDWSGEVLMYSPTLLSPSPPSYEYLPSSSLWKNCVDFLHPIPRLFVQALTLASANVSPYLFACSSLSTPKSPGSEFTRGPIPRLSVQAFSLALANLWLTSAPVLSSMVAGPPCYDPTSPQCCASGPPRQRGLGDGSTVYEHAAVLSASLVDPLRPRGFGGGLSYASRRLQALRVAGSGDLSISGPSATLADPSSSRGHGAPGLVGSGSPPAPPPQLHPPLLGGPTDDCLSVHHNDTAQRVFLTLLPL